MREARVTHATKMKSIAHEGKMRLLEAAREAELQFQKKEQLQEVQHKDQMNQQQLSFFDRIKVRKINVRFRLSID